MINERPFNYLKTAWPSAWCRFAGGIFSTLYEEKKKQSMNADDVLDQIKAAFLKKVRSKVPGSILRSNPS